MEAQGVSRHCRVVEVQLPCRREDLLHTKNVDKTSLSLPAEVLSPEQLWRGKQE